MAELLVVDDEEGILEGLAAVLRLRGHRVHCATNAAQARALLADNRPDLLLADYKLPDGDGLTLALAARNSDPAIHVIMMTGFADDELRRRFSSIARGRLVEKPTAVSEITAAIEDLLSPPFLVPAIQGAGPEQAAADGARALGASKDACDLVALAAYAFSLAGKPVEIEVAREGDVLRVEASWPTNVRPPSLDGARWILDLLGGDLQTFAGGLRLGLPVDGQPEGGGDDLSRFRPRTPEELARRAHTSAQPFNAPSWLRLLCELAGEGRLLPRRRQAGGRLPADVAELWS